MNGFEAEVLKTVLKEFNISEIQTKRTEDELGVEYLNILVFFDYKTHTFNTWERLPVKRHNGKPLNFKDIRICTEYNILETLQFAEEVLFKKREEPRIDIKRKLVENTAALCETQLHNLYKMGCFDGIFNQNDPKSNSQRFIERAKKLFEEGKTPLEIYDQIMQERKLD